MNTMMRCLPLALAAAIAMGSALPGLAAEPPRPLEELAAYDEAKAGNAATIKARYSGFPRLDELLSLGLLCAVRRGDLAQAQAFLDAGASPNRAPSPFDYCSPLELADALRKQPISDLLIARGADRNDGGPSAFGGIAQAGAQVLLGSHSPLGSAGGNAAKTMAAGQRAVGDFYKLLDEAERPLREKAEANRLEWVAAEKAREAAEAEAREQRQAAEEAAERAAIAAQEKAQADERKKQGAIFGQLLDAVIARNGQKARTLYGQLGGEVLTEANAVSLEAVSSKVNEKRGVLVFLFAKYLSPAPGGSIAQVRGTSQIIFVTGIRAGSMVAGEEFDLVAEITGTHTYRTITGALNTVPGLALKEKF